MFEVYIGFLVYGYLLVVYCIEVDKREVVVVSGEVVEVDVFVDDLCIGQ